MKYLDQIVDATVKARVGWLEKLLDDALANREQRPSDVASAILQIVVEMEGWKTVAASDSPPEGVVIDELLAPWPRIRQSAGVVVSACRELLLKARR